MRGILVQSLVSRGVPFDVALETATAIRDRIAAKRQVLVDELSSLVDEILGLGPLQPLLDDAGIEEIIVNGPRRTFVIEHGQKERTPWQWKIF